MVEVNFQEEKVREITRRTPGEGDEGNVSILVTITTPFAP